MRMLLPRNSPEGTRHPAVNSFLKSNDMIYMSDLSRRWAWEVFSCSFPERSAVLNREDQVAKEL